MSTPRPTANPAARGAAIVLIAVAIGVAVLLKGFDNDDSNAATPKAAATTVVTVPTTPATTPVTPAPGATKVVVANGAKVSGAAGNIRNRLLGKNYTVLNVANVTSSAKMDLSSVYYTEGSDLQAKAIATDLGIKSDRVKLLPGDAPPISPKLPANANVLVVVGTDVATAR